ncbi:MAG TPA: xanthine dehydrogenase family protein molybdopterin-binding subunit [Candidatus Acidoferrales bacterium]|nr:xanthine dehydrogenase family protein molybdopterin-binding subunit [Candidatus Acidoferrales bacterium]
MSRPRTPSRRASPFPPRSRTRRSGNARSTIHRPAVVGVSVPRLDGADKVTGRALYLDDLRVPGVLHGRTVRSTTARGRIAKIELDPAFDWRGVTVCDHRDIPGENVVALIEDDQPLLAAEFVNHWDEPILLLAHEDPERAEAAAHAVKVTIEPLPAALTVEDALARRVLLRGDDNVFKTIRIERGDLDAAFASADLVFEGEYRCGHQEQLYIENNAMLAERTADGGIFVRGSLQCPYYIHGAMQRLLALPPEKVRVAQTVTGGGFGGKEEYPSMIAGHAAVLAWKSGRPVKIVYDRLEDIAATTKRHPAIVRLRTGVHRDGTLVALDADVVMDGGAYLTLTPVVLSRGAIHAGGSYRWQASRIVARAVATHTPPNGAFRGFGAPQTLFAIESHLNRIAAGLGIDPFELRRRNAVREGDTTVTGQVLRESVGAHEVLERTVERSRWSARRARFDRENAAAEAAERRGHAAKDGRRLRRGIGCALVYHGGGFTGSGEVKLDSLAALDLTPEGWPRVRVANTEIGQGTVTVFSQVVGDVLGIPASRVVIHPPDTDAVPNSGPTVASRTVMVVGGLIEGCAQQLKEKLERFAERPLDGERDYLRVARRWLAERGPLRVEQRYRKPAAIVWSEETYQGDAYGVFSYAAIAVEVEVDLDTAETKVLNVHTSQDIGRAIHPILAAGQIEGGTLQALGWALLEEVRWKDGRVWNHQLTNYIIPTSADSPPIDVDLVEIPYSLGPRGAKGVGELPMDVPAPAVIEAIAQATGCRLTEIPATPERLMRALRGRPS